MKYNKILLLLFLPLISCSMMIMEDPPPPETSPARILLIVDQSILTALSDELTVYSQDIQAEGGTVEIRPFSSEDSVEELKALIISRRDYIDGAFLVGDLPTAWYEQSAFGRNEQFPIDIFLMDLDASWSDTNGNNLYDDHGPLSLSIYVSRITGSSDEINNYFSKLHDYRIGNYEYLGGAYIFKDEDWFNTDKGSRFGLERLYPNVEINEKASNTVREDYISRMTDEGADYVYQWIHATPVALYISDGEDFDTVTYTDISANNVKGRFLNMFNCKGARYTQTNLAMTYLTDTETGLAATGSSKVGGNYYPLEFHRTLNLGSCWGNAFKSWYNYFGSKNDEWFLGMVITGDPALQIKDSETDRSLSKSSFLSIVPPSEEELENLGLNLIDFEDLESSFH